MPNEYEQPVEPMSRTEDLLRTGTEEPVIAMSEIEKILRGEHIDRPHSRVADLLLQYNPSDILIEKRIEENGTYYATADSADGYYKVVVDTPVIPPTVLEHLVETISTNGTHTFTPGTGVDGYSDATITVDVPPNVMSRGLTVNGTFSSAVDNKDGYSSVTVDVQKAPVKTTSLSVTENGTYVPDPASEISLTIPTIPDEVETDVSAGAAITNFDNLRIEFTNKTTSATGHVNIYPSAIAVQQIPMSFKNRTLIMGPDGDHYITIVNGYDSIVVLQKGYTITAMKLTSYSGYFDEVNVNVKTKNITYLYDWDFKTSLTDKIGNVTATLLKGLTRDSSGLHFTSPSHSCRLFNNFSMLGKTLEIDISSMSLTGGNYVVTHGDVTNAEGYSPLTYQSYGGNWNWRVNGMNNTAPGNKISAPYNTNLGADAFNNKTVKIVYLTDGTLLYVDDKFVGRQSECNLTKNSLKYMWLGGSGYTSAYYSGNSYYNMTITGARIYVNTLVEKTIVSNGTTYAPDENADGYVKVTTNIPLGTKSITANDTYAASDDNYAGYSEVTVNVSPNVGTKSITSNGTYNASSDSLDGYSQVVVDVAASTSNLDVGYNRIFTDSQTNIFFDSNTGKIQSYWSGVTTATSIANTVQGRTDLNGTISVLHITGNITDSYEYANKTGYERCQFVVGFSDRLWDQVILVGYNDSGSVYIKEEIELTNVQSTSVDIFINLKDAQYQQYASTPKYLFISLFGIEGEFKVELIPDLAEIHVPYDNICELYGSGFQVGFGKHSMVSNYFNGSTLGCSWNGIVDLVAAGYSKMHYKAYIGPNSYDTQYNQNVRPVVIGVTPTQYQTMQYVSPSTAASVYTDYDMYLSSDYNDVTVEGVIDFSNETDPQYLLVVATGHDFEMLDMWFE